uniref:Minor outer capsid protein P9 n=1 Tax=Tobacco leaf enation phytoreovirus TaxID=288891 RepID=A2RQI7_9REOV|nr:unknown [Tobacco leaf enation phytoreovirus]
MAGILQDGVAIRRIGDAISFFMKYTSGILQNNRHAELNALHLIRRNVGQCWAPTLMSCWIACHSHAGVMRFLIDIASSTRFGDFTLLGSCSLDSPFTDVELIFRKACSAMKLSDTCFITPPVAVVDAVNEFFYSEQLKSTINMSDSVHHIEEYYLTRMESVSSLLHTYYLNTQDLPVEWTANLPSADAGVSNEQKIRSQMELLIKVIREEILLAVSRFVALYEKHHNEHYRRLAASYKLIWFDVELKVPADLSDSDNAHLSDTQPSSSGVAAVESVDAGFLSSEVGDNRFFSVPQRRPDANLDDISEFSA